VENEKGGFFIEGGMYKLISALTDLSIKSGIKFFYNSEVKSIKVYITK
jgi:phytoene dehydrogenase-like protein